MPVRYPRAFAVIGDKRIPFIDCTVTRTSKKNTDRFQGNISITEAARHGIYLEDWADWQPVDVTVVMSLAIDGSDEREMITGKVDLPNISWAKMHVAIGGRDNSASLVESKRSEKFANQKPKEIAEKVAQAHKLTLNFKGDADFSGKKYGEDFAHLVLNKTDWEVLTSVAEQIGYRFYVDGSTLYMEPKTEGGDSFDIVWVPPWEGEPAFANITNLSTKRNMSAARPHEYEVKSWHGRSKKLFKSKANVDGVGEPLVFTDHHNGKTQSQVESLAKSRVRAAIRHELSITYQGPARLDADVRKVLNLSGTRTIYDQGYSVETITWNFGYGEEFHMVVDCTAAKSGRDPEGNEGSASQTNTSATNGSGGGDAAAEATPETQGPNQPSPTPLPPSRPSGLSPSGGPVTGVGPILSV